MDPKKILQRPSLAYTSNPNFSKPPKTPNPVSNVYLYQNGYFLTIQHI